MSGLHLQRGFKATGNGGLYLGLETGTPPEIALLPPPRDIRLANKPEPFSIERNNHDSGWGEEEYLSVAVYKDTKGGILYERVFHNQCPPKLDDAILSVGARYVLMAQLSGPEARYSKPFFMAFRVEAREEACKVCRLSGWIIPQKEIFTVARPFSGKQPLPRSGLFGKTKVLQDVTNQLIVDF